MIGNKNDIITFLLKQPESKDFELREYKKKRSRSQNSYYWELVGKLATKCAKDGLTKSRIHNLNLRALGICDFICGNRIFVEIRDTDEAENIALESETLHLAPTSKTKTNLKGETFRTYVMLKGSHNFDTEEMTALLDLMIAQCKEQDIETLTPAQLADLRRLEMEATN